MADIGSQTSMHSWTLFLSCPSQEYQLGGAATPGWKWDALKHAISIQDVIDDIMFQVGPGFRTPASSWLSTAMRTACCGNPTLMPSLMPIRIPAQTSCCGNPCMKLGPAPSPCPSPPYPESTDHPIAPNRPTA